jgi:hypothetical protein
MSEKSILDMTNDEILSLIHRNKRLREEATQEKLVAREREKNEREVKTKAKGHKDAATDILKAYMDSVEPKVKTPVTKEKARDMATDILKAYMEQQEREKGSK